MTITVTPTHADAGYPRECAWCAVALALNAATGQRWWVSSDEAVLYDRVQDRTFRRVPLPASVQRLILDLDAGRAVRLPLTFEFEWAG